MAQPARLVTSLLLASFLFGILADLLLRALPWGMNGALWLAGLVCAAVIIARMNDVPLIRGWQFAGMASVVSAAFLVVRASPQLAFLNLVGALAGLQLMLSRTKENSLARSGTLELAGSAVAGGVHACIGSLFLVFSDVPWSALAAQRRSRKVLATVRGGLFALPVLLVFGGLLTAADAGFEELINGVFAFDLSEALFTAVIVGGVSWILCGYFRGRYIAPTVLPPPVSLPASFTETYIETITVVGLLDLLLGTFVALQFPYLFGGSAIIASTPGMTYAAFARRGFFELLGVLVLSLPLLTGAHWLFRSANRMHLRIFRVLSGSLILLLLLILASAMLRLDCYRQVYGLTGPRIYAAAFMLWLGLDLLWFGATILRGKDRGFAAGASVSAFLVLWSLNVCDPDALTASTNLALARTGRQLDMNHLLLLSADAVPVIVDALPQLEPAGRSLIARRLLATTLNQEDADWRTWNRARAIARGRVRGSKELLRQISQEPQSTGASR